MKKYIIGFFLFGVITSFGQNITSGNYGSMNVAFDLENNLITGFYENYTGRDQQFSCIFYLEGKVVNDRAEIISYYPGEKNISQKTGEMNIQNDSTFTLLLKDEHGGCWNVEDFINEPAKFNLEEQQNNVQIRIVKNKKAYFHADENESSRQKAYVIQGDILFVEKVDGDWAYCSFYGKTKTTGWISINDLNDLGDKQKKLPTPVESFLLNVNLNSDETIDNYIEMYFTGGENEIVLKKTSWDTDGEPSVCHTSREFNEITVEKYNCEQFPLSTYRFKGYTRNEVLRIMRFLFLDDEYEHWKDDEFIPIEEGVGCYLSIEEKPFETVVSYGCGC